MKKVISISLALAMILLIFAGCSKAPTKEDLLANAVEVSVDVIDTIARENLARVKENYCNKALLLKGKVESVSDDHVVIAGIDSYTIYRVDAYLPTEDLVNLEAEQQITVVGVMTEEIIDVGGDRYYQFDYQMPTAYLVEAVTP